MRPGYGKQNHRATGSKGRRFLLIRTHSICL